MHDAIMSAYQPSAGLEQVLIDQAFGPSEEYCMVPTPSLRPSQRHHALNALLRDKTRTKDRMSQFLDEKLRSQLKHTKE